MFEFESVIFGDSALSAAIGLVVAESALNDDFLRVVLCEITDGDRLWPLFEGQSSDWLSQSTRLMVEHADPYEKRWGQSCHETIRACLKELDELRPLRNAIVHGVWLRDGPRAPETALARPWGERFNELGTERIYGCQRSRFRNVGEERWLTVGDVEELARRLCRCRRDFRAAIIQGLKQEGRTHGSWLDLG